MQHQVNRRQMLKMGAGGAAGILLDATSAPLLSESLPSESLPSADAREIEQWGCFEVMLPGPHIGNPFEEVTFTGSFHLGNRIVSVPGFYDGEGRYLIRFMPDAPGKWTYTTQSSHKELAEHKGALTVVPSRGDNHGPVQVSNRFHFAYSDGKPYFPFGTTCYSMGFMGEPFETETLDALKEAGFNKVRLCLLPKPQGERQLPLMPFERATGSQAGAQEDLKDGAKSHETFDLSRLNPAYFRHFEARVRDLLRLNIQADIILFHPYDAWGFRSMPADVDDRYLRYAIARISAYRNVWWSIANEYDLVRSKTLADWDRFFRITQECDPYNHLRSIHHSKVVYDHAKLWCTHASLQEYDFQRSSQRRAAWNKPIVYDEIQYEGNISARWGNITPEEMTRRFWLATVAGTYATHGETYIVPKGEPMWSDGGKLRGTSAPRINFLRNLLEKLPIAGLNEFPNAYYLSAGIENEVYLYYFDTHALAEYDFPLPLGIKFTGTLIDPFAMTTETLPGIYTGKTKEAHFVDENVGDQISGQTNHVKLPGRPYLAVLFQRVKS